MWGGLLAYFNVTQPWLQGFDGDYYMGVWNKNAVFARLWIDQALKREWAASSGIARQSRPRGLSDSDWLVGKAGWAGSVAAGGDFGALGESGDSRPAGPTAIPAPSHLRTPRDNSQVSAMRAYTIRRLLLVVPTLLILSMIVFLLVRFIPGDVIDAMQEDFAFTAGEIDREALERKLGLDQSIPVQYARWLGDIVLHGSLGQSLLGRFSVNWLLPASPAGQSPRHAASLQTVA